MTQAADPRPPGPRDWKCDYSLNRVAVHIRPRNDLMWHPLDDDCPCGPATNYLDLDADVQTRWLVIHRALDGRAAQGGGYSPAPAPTDNTDWHRRGPDDGPVCA